MIAKSIYLFFLDHEIHQLFGIEKAYGKQRVYNDLMMATKIALLICEESILVPASNYFESDFSFKLLNALGTSKANEAGYIRLLTSSYNLDELLHKKEEEHGESITKVGYHYVDFLDPKEEIYLPGSLVKREKSASLDIRKVWLSETGIEKLGKTIYSEFPDEYTAIELEKIISGIPDSLGKRAYISKYITHFFRVPPKGEARLDNIINGFITTEYIRSFLDEFDAVCLNDIPILKSADNLLPQGPDYQHVSYSKYASLLRKFKFRGQTVFDYLKLGSIDDLILFKNSSTWSRFLELQSEGTSNTIISGGAINRRRERNMNRSNISIGIITALPKEYAAVKKMMASVEEVFNNERENGERYLVGTIRAADNAQHNVALIVCEEGNNKAAVGCTEMLKNFPSIKAIVMCGIAGGVPNPSDPSNHVRLGDIVVSKYVFQYDYGKKTECGWESKTVPIGSSSVFQRAIRKIQADEYENKYGWHEYIDSFAVDKFIKPNIESDILFSTEGEVIEHPLDPSRTAYPTVHYGCIASGNSVLKDPATRDQLRDKYKIKAVEMEGSGITDAAYNEKVDFIIVRGICDYCDSHKNDTWQEYAALVAAAYTRTLIENIPSFHE